MKTNFLLLLSFIFLVFSCSEKSKSNSDNIDLEGSIQNAEKRIETDPNASGENKCLLDYQNKYDQLLTEDEVLAATGFKKENLESEYNKVLKNPEYHDFEFKFTNGRLRTVPMLKQKLPVPDNVTLQGIKAISLAEFENRYKAITEEEMQNSKNVLNDAADGKLTDENVNEALKKAEELKVSKEQVKESGGQILDVIKDISKGYRIVDNLGDSARWNVVTNELAVLQNGV